MTTCLSLPWRCVVWHFFLGMRRNQNFEKVTFPFLFSIFLSFCYSDWSSTGLASRLKTSEKASLRRTIFTMEQPRVIARNFAQSFSLKFLGAFLCIFHAPLSQSLWSGYQWKDLFLLQKSSKDDANFGQRRQGWWRQKWDKGQGSSLRVTGGMRVNGLKMSRLHFTLEELYIVSVLG